MKCNHCGEEISSTDLTCPRCNHFVDSQPQPVQPQKGRSATKGWKSLPLAHKIILAVIFVFCAFLMWPLLLVLLVDGIAIFLVLAIVLTAAEWLRGRLSKDLHGIRLSLAFKLGLPAMLVWTFALLSILEFVVDQLSIAEYYRNKWTMYAGALSGLLACAFAFRYLWRAHATGLSVVHKRILQVGVVFGAMAFVVQGVEVAVSGFPYPYTHADYQSPKDAMSNNLTNLGALAYQYRVRPKEMGGGGSETYAGFNLPSRLDSTDEAYYFIEAAERDLLRLTAISMAKKDTMRLTLDEEGRSSLGTLFYGESASKSDKQDAHLWYLSRQAIAYRARQASERGRASYLGFSLSENDASTGTGTFKVYVHNDRFVEFGAEPGHRYFSNRFILDDRGRLCDWTNFRDVDEILSALAVLRDHAKVYINCPVSEQGGGGSPGGYQIPQNLTEDFNARYHAVIHADYIEFIALARQRRDTVISILNIDGTARPISYGWDFDAQR